MKEEKWVTLLIQMGATKESRPRPQDSAKNLVEAPNYKSYLRVSFQIYQAWQWATIVQK